MMEVLAGAGLPVPEGFVLTARAHSRLLYHGGFMDDILELAGQGGSVSPRAAELRRRHRSRPMEERLNKLICKALPGLDARTVAVRSEMRSEGSLGTIPAVLSAVRRCWLSAEGSRRQIEAILGGEELPVWPLVVHRELRPGHTGWSSTAGHVYQGFAVEPRGPGAALYDLKPTGGRSGERESISEMTRRAGHVLGVPTRLYWGLEKGRWYLLSVRREDRARAAEDKKAKQRRKQ